MRKFRSYLQVVALITGLLLTVQLATFADKPLFKERDTSSIIAQTDESTPAPAIDEKADAILRQSSEFIESQEKFSFSAETERDILTTSGVYLQVAHKADTIVNRPNQFWANTTGDVVQREFWYDGEQVTVVDTERNIYASGDAPGSMDETLDGSIPFWKKHDVLEDVTFNLSSIKKI